MRKKIVFCFVPLISIIFFSCTNASEEDLIDALETIPIVTYTTHVKEIIDNNCIVCHSNPPVNGASIPLETYEEVRTGVTDHNLIARIASEDLGYLMPFGGPKLPQNLIDIVEQWEADGLLE